MKLAIAVAILLNFVAFSSQRVRIFNEEEAQPMLKHPWYRKVFNDIFPKEDTRGGRIIGGAPASWGQFPFQTLLYMSNGGNSRYLCGGVLIKNNLVLTAAHCVQGFTLITVNVGLIDRTNTMNILFRTDVTSPSDLIYHPNYNNVSLKNDIAIIHIPNAPTDLLTKFGSNVSSIALPPDNTDTFNKYTGTISGFGKTSDSSSASSILNFANAPIISNTECAAFFGSYITSGNICIGNANKTVNICNGDSGGPLTVVKNGVKMLAGITSFGSGSGCNTGAPGGFTRVSVYLKWIKSYITKFP